MIIYHLISITIAYIIDLLIGDPPRWPHPVRWIGSMISFIEVRLNNGESKKLKGVIMLLFVLFISFIVCLLIVLIGYKIHPIAGICIESMIIATTIAQKSLKKAALEVYLPLKKGDLMDARIKLSYIVGRDTDSLNEGEIARGAIETVAENTSDGVTAPLFWALIGGAPLAIVYRATNTCDSMVGHVNDKYKEFGWASAKWDDLMNWIPSRITGFFMLIANRPEHMSLRMAWAILYRDAKKHPSPNSGWGEAAVAAIIGIQLGGINYYKGMISNRAKMGEPILPIHSGHIIKANEILSKTVVLFLLFLWIGGAALELAFTWLKSAVPL
ncbi:adenosylcobinamide-phosphate synthase CbiB [Paenibacillus sp. BSR1-1]|uniref:adenosylcobinamide-phosphate synthase CbiB n=1 Tax=Paenibacillus sp. BSR1-1 TaxID=3020845 RepID=UPI0025B15021|nr:adenosylcobinamide-phosphate synthase CbiB [Paenibacillus sp. BSR1-1]MDN3015266.1 adenosylcobinamide-phosphate synthase CbiB [Paenibacillus sp. BSR1-1]